MSLVWVSLMTWAEAPCMLGIVAPLFTRLLKADYTVSALGNWIYVLCCVNLFLFLCFNLLIHKFFLVNIPSLRMPWSQSSSHFATLKPVVSLAAVITELYVTAAKLPPIFDLSYYLIMPCMIISSAQLLAHVVLLPITFHSPLIHQLRDLLTFLLTFCSLFTQLMLAYYSYAPYFLGIILLPMGTLAFFLVLRVRRDQAVDKMVKKGRQQQHGSNIEKVMEFEEEYRVWASVKLGMLNDGERWERVVPIIIRYHNDKCHHGCACSRSKAVQYLVNLYQHQRFCQKSKFLDGDDIQAVLKLFSDSLETPSDHFTVHQLSGQRGQPKSQPVKVKVHLPKLKQSLIVLYLELIVKDALNRHPNSVQLRYFEIFVAMQILENTYLTEYLLCQMDSRQLRKNWVQKLQFNIHKIHILRTLAMMTKDTQARQTRSPYYRDFEEEEDLLQVNEVQTWGITSDQRGESKSNLFNAEHFILMSELTTHFYQTAQSLAITVQAFWKKLNVYQSVKFEPTEAKVMALELADLIDDLGRVYQEIESQNDRGGQATRGQIDYRICYTYAQVQRLLYNDIMQHDLQLQKMISQKELARLIQYNTLMNGSQNHADDNNTGFVLVQVSSNINEADLSEAGDFCKIRMANQLFRDTLGGYTDQEIKKLNISHFMPKLIRDWHHLLFVAAYSQDGCKRPTRMLDKITCQWMINRKGNILPAFVNAKYHYNEKLGHSFVCFTQFLKQLTLSDGQSYPLSRVLTFICNPLDGNSITNFSKAALQAFHVDTFNDEQFSRLSIDDISMTSPRDLEQVSLDLMSVRRSYNGAQYADIFAWQTALCSVFRHHYAEEREMVVFCFVLNDQPKEQSKSQKSKGSQRARQEQIEQEEEEYFDNQSAAVQEFLRGDDGPSASHSSRTGGSSDASNLKSIYQTNDAGTSSSLKLITQLIVVVFLLLLVVSTINLVLSLDRNTKLQSEIGTVKLSYDRLARHVQMRQLLRGMIAMANDYQDTDSRINKDSFSAYIEKYREHIGEMKKVHDQIDKNQFEYSEKFKEMLTEKRVSLEYLDQHNQATFDNHTYSFAVNLFIQRAIQILNWPIQRFKGKIRILNIDIPPSSYIPTEDERLVYFLNRGGQGPLRGFGKNISNQFKEEICDHALKVADQTQLTIIISIVAIIIVSLIVSPIFCRIEERKYMGLKFFLQVKSKDMGILDQQVQEFLESISQDVKRQKKLKHKLDKALVDTHFFQDDTQDDEMSSSQSNSLKFSSQSENEYASSMMSSNREFLGSDLIACVAHGMTIRREIRSVQESAQLQVESSQACSQRSKQSHQVSQETEDQKSEREGEAVTLQNDKLYKIGRVVHMAKVKTIGVVCLIAMSFSSYFVVGYFFSVNSFAQTPNILSDLDTVYFKDITIDTLMAFVREDYVRNELIPSAGTPWLSGTVVFLDRIEQRQNSYLLLRKNLPSAFSTLKQYFDDLESPKLCQVTLGYQNQSLVELCKQVHFGILRSGLTKTVDVMTQHFRNLHIKFTTNLNRTKQFQLENLRARDTLDFIEIQEFVMDRIYIDIKEKVTDATTVYYRSLIDQYKILYSAFIVLMTGLFTAYMVLGYQKIKRSMWKTNLILKILPLEVIPKLCLPDLKAFFKY